MKYTPATAPHIFVTAPSLLSWYQDFSCLLYSRYHEVSETMQVALSFAWVTCV